MVRAALPHVWRPSANYNERDPDATVDMLVLHYTGMVSAEAALERLCDPGAEVSCHYLVDLEGGVVQMIGEQWKAWHAGPSCWYEVTDNNSRSIGVEIQNKGHELGYHSFPEAQMASVEALCLDILSRHDGIASYNVVAHSDIAPGRKCDPGEMFDWERLAKAGIGHWVAPTPVEPGPVLQLGDRGKAVGVLQAMLSLYGYGLEHDGTYGRLTHDVVFAFQRHWRQARCDGVADVSTIETLRSLLFALPDEAFAPDVDDVSEIEELRNIMVEMPLRELYELTARGIVA